MTWLRPRADAPPPSGGSLASSSSLTTPLKVTQDENKQSQSEPKVPAASSSLSKLLTRTQPPTGTSSSGVDKRTKAMVDADTLFSRLTAEQKRILDLPVKVSNAILVKAGAGSGKTAILVGRVLRLVLQNHVKETHILCLTFSKKAAGEMRQRLGKVLGSTHGITVENLHRVALHALQEFGFPKEALGFSSFPSNKVQILNESEERYLVEYACLRMLMRMPGMPTHDELVRVMVSGDKLVDDEDEDDEDGEEPCLGTSSSRGQNFPAWFVPNKFRRAVDHSRVPRPVVRPTIVSSAQAMVSEAIAQLLAPQDVVRLYGKEIAQVYHLVKAFLSSLRMATMAMLVPAFLKVLQSNSQVRACLAKRYRFVFVDEAQDLSPVELEAIYLFCEASSLMCVGDEDQSIYSFRNNKPAQYQTHNAFEWLMGRFPQATAVDLKTNYRCPSSVVDAATRLISHNVRRSVQMMQCNRPEVHDHGVIKVIPCGDTVDEARKVCDLVSDALRDNPGQSIGILARANRALKPVELELRKRRINVRDGDNPRNTVGSKSVRISAQEETFVHSLMAYAKLAIGSKEKPDFSLEDMDEALKRCWTYPRRQGLGKRSWDRLMNERRNKEETLLEVARRVVDISEPSFPKKTLGGLSRLLDRIDGFSILAGQTDQLQDLLLEMFRSLRSEDEEDRSQEKGLDHAFKLMLVDCKEMENDALAINWGYTEKKRGWVPMIKALDNGDRPELQRDGTSLSCSDAVFLGTIHQAKGLEFDLVFVLRCNEGVMPTLKPNRTLLFSSSSDKEDSEDADEERSIMEEERRCAYVAVTRTRKRLFMSYVVRDDDAAMHLLPSRFLEEMQLFTTSSASSVNGASSSSQIRHE